ncbi:MAG: hypothetical protein IIA67_00940, partial [Planctomycetes bacterium]|nr:hypothetical protein [Planctomycetota bacterium]
MSAIGDRFEIENLMGDAEGNFEAVTLRSPEDYSAIDVSYVCGEEIVEENKRIAEELGPLSADEQEREKAGRLLKLDQVEHDQPVAGGLIVLVRLEPFLADRGAVAAFLLC